MNLRESCGMNKCTVGPHQFKLGYFVLKIISLRFALQSFTIAFSNSKRYFELFFVSLEGSK